MKRALYAAIILCSSFAMSFLPFGNNAYAIVGEDSSGPSDQEETKPQFASDHIVVKFKSKETADALRNSIAKRARPRANKPALDQLLSKYASSVKPAFKGLGNSTAEQKALELKQRFPGRAKRVSPSTAIPALERTFVIQTLTGANVEQAIHEFANDPEVAYAEPDYLRKVQMVPNDPYYSSSGTWGQPYDDLWGVKKINSEPAWDIARGEGVVVAVIDSGVDYEHEDIAQNIWANEGEIPSNGIDDDNNGFIDDVRGWDFVSCGNFDGSGNCTLPAMPDNNPMDQHGHGTHVSGTIAAVGNNGIGVIGVAPAAKIMPLRGLNQNGSGLTSWLADAIYYAAENGADVTNNSWGGSGSNQTLTDAFNYAYSLGVVSLAAAGNSNTPVEFTSPAGIDSVIAVAALDYQDIKASFSNYGQKISISSPGVEILSLRANGTDMYLGSMGYTPGARFVPAFDTNAKYYRANGTSMACPHAAGVTAGIISAFPNLSNTEVWELLVGTTDGIYTQNPSYADRLGTGRANLFNALSNDASLPYLTIIQQTFDDLSIDDNNSVIDPGETINFFVTLRNIGVSTTNVVGILETNDPLVTIVHNTSSFGNISLNQQATNQIDPFIIHFDPSLSVGTSTAFSLTVTSSSGYSRKFSNIELTVAHYYASNLPGWPIAPWGQQVFIGAYNSFVVGDVGFTKGKEAVVTTIQGELKVWSHDGMLLLEVAPLGYPAPPQNIPSLGDLDGDGLMEIVFRTFDNNLGGRMYAINNGNVSTIVSDSMLVNRPIVLDDLDGDGSLEIIEVTLSQLGVSTGGGKVFVRNQFGQILPGWPQQPIIPTSSNQTVFGSDVATGDLDRDGVKEIVLSLKKAATGNTTGPKLFVFNLNGTIKWSYQFPNYTNYTNINPGTPFDDVVLSDMDGNDGGLLEVVYFENGQNRPSFNNFAYVFGHDGNIQSQWIVSHTEGFYAGEQPQIALGDLDLDGDLELMLATAIGSNRGRILAWHHNGELLQGFPAQVPNDITGPVMVSDVDGNGVPDIVSSLSLSTSNNYLNRIYVWDNQGNMLPYGPINLVRQNLMSIVALPSFSQTTLSDLDSNGMLDLIAPIGSLEAHAVNLLVSVDPGTMYWPMYRQNAQRTGCYTASNQAPVLAQIGNQNANEGQLLEFTVHATDPDSVNSLTLSVSDPPSGAAFSDQGNGTGLFTWTPGFNQAGIYSVTFSVSDGELTDTETIIITVQNVGIWVDVNGSGDYQDIQSAISASPAGSEIKVVQGTYTIPAGDVVVWQNKDLIIQGGFNVVGGVLDPVLYPTIIDGTNVAFRSCVYTSGLTSASHISGFILQGGKNGRNNNGAGIHNNNSDLTISRCVFRSNSANWGAGISNLNGSDPLVTHSMFYSNSAYYGAAIHNNQNSNAKIVNSVFYSNTSTYGGAIRNVSSNLSIVNCSFGGNRGTVGKTMHNRYSHPTVLNSILWNGGGEIVDADGYVSTVTYSDIQGSFPGQGNIALDPRYVSVSTGNLRLQATSPAIDTGTANGASSDDIDGNPRPLGNGYDMGSYETSGKKIAPVDSLT